MTRKWAVILALVLAIICIGFGTYLSVYFDQITIIPKTQTFIDPLGKPIEFSSPTYKDHYELTKYFSEVLFTIGAALLVFLIVERFLNTLVIKQEKEEINRLNEELRKNVFDGVLKTIIDPELFKIVVKDVFDEKLVRKNARWDYEITENDCGGYTMFLKIKFDLVNNSQQLKKEKFRTMAVSNKINEAYFDSFKVVDLNDKERINNDRAKIAETAVTDDNIQEGYQEFDIDANETVKVAFKIVNIYRTLNVFDSNWCKHSIIGLDISVHKPKDYNFIMTGTFSESLEIEPGSDDQLIVYKHLQGLLKGQSVNYIIEKLPSVNPV